MGNSTEKTILYRYFDSEGELLYLGITGNNLRRQSEHRRDSGWFDLVCSATFQHFDSRSEAEMAERMAITKERPIYNKTYNQPDHSQFNLMGYFGKLHLISMLAGKDINGNEVEVDVSHKNFIKFIRKAEKLKGHHDWNLDEAIASQLALAPIFTYSPCLKDCEACMNLYSSDWYSETLSAAKQKTAKARHERRRKNANH